MEEVSCLFGHEGPAELLFERPDWWLGTAGRFAWYRCPTCGLRFLNPRPTLAEIDGYYPAEYAAYRPAIAEERWRLMRWKRRRNLQPLVKGIMDRSPSPGALLDVGCATGNFLAEMRRQGWRVQGVELKPEAAAYARQRLQLDVFTGDLLASPFPPDSFDVVTLWDVLEHTHDPVAILQKVYELLRPEGLLAFSIPDPDSAGAQTFGPYWIGYDAPRHLYLFSGDSLRLLLKKSQFNFLDQDYFLGTYHTWVASFQTWLNAHNYPSPVRASLERLSHLPIWAPVTAPYFQYLNRAGKGSIVTVYARAGK